jgi:Spy/CpxP family protein refolding chaperone
MEHEMLQLKSLLLATAMALGASAALAQQPPASQASPGWGWGKGPGMMGGYGARGEYGPGYHRGRGAMMGGGYGRGMGMMGLGVGALAGLDLSDSQRKQVLAIEDEVRKANWATMGAMHDEMAKLRNTSLLGETRDRAAITASNKRMFELRQQMLDRSLDAADKIEKILTPQQREQLKKNWGPWWMLDDDE